MMTRGIFIAFTLTPVVFDKSSNAFTIHQLKQTQQLHHQSFQLNLNPEYESPFWFATFKEDDHSLDERSDFPSPFWFATFTENDSSSEEDESSSFLPPQTPLSSHPDSPSSFWFATLEEDVSLSNKDESSASTPTEPALSGVSELPDVNPTTLPPETGFKLRDFALATQKIAEEGAKLVSNVHVNTTFIAAEAASAAKTARAVAKEMAAGLVAATSTLTETTRDAETLKTAKLAVALATAGGDIVKSVGVLVKDALVDSAIKPPGAAVVDAPLEKPAPKEIIKVDAETVKAISLELAKEKSNVVETFVDDSEEETREIINNTPDAVLDLDLDLQASTLVADDDLVRASSNSIANNQNDKELNKLSAKPAKENTDELEKTEESSIEETFLSDSNTETINNIPDNMTVIDLEAQKPVKEGTLAKVNSITNDQNGDELLDHSDEAMTENTTKSEISEESGGADAFMNESESETIDKSIIANDQDNEELIRLSDDLVERSTYESEILESDFEEKMFLSELETNTIDNILDDNIPDVATALDLQTSKAAATYALSKTASIAKDQNDEEIIKVNEEPVEENTNSIKGIESVFDLEVSKPVEDNVLQRSTSVATAENDEEQSKLEGKPLREHTQELEKVQTTLFNGLALEAPNEISQQQQTSNELVREQDSNWNDSQSNSQESPLNHYQSSSITGESSDYENFAGSEGGYGRVYGNYYDQRNRDVAEETTIVEADNLPSFHQLYEQRDNQRRNRQYAAEPYITNENVYGGGYNYDYNNRDADYYDGSRTNNNESDEITEQQQIATEQLPPNPSATNFYSSTSSNTITKESFNNYGNVAASRADSDPGYNNHYHDRANTNTKDIRVQDDGLPSFHDLYDRRMNGQ